MDETAMPSSANSNQRDMVVITIALLLPTFVTIVYFVLLRNASAAVQQLAYTIGKAIQFGLPVLWVFGVQRRRWEWSRVTPRGLIIGIGFGCLVVAAMMALYYGWLRPAGLLAGAEQQARTKVLGFGIDRLSKYLGLAVFYSLVHAFLEEYYWRWFVFGQLRQLTASWAAVILSSVGFMAHHVIVLALYFGWDSAATYLFSLAVAIGGVVWAWLYDWSDSLLGPWASHLLVDAGIFLIGLDLVRSVL